MANSNLPPAMPRTVTLRPALSSTFGGAANGFRIVQFSPRSERTTTPLTDPAASTLALTRNAPTARSVLNDAASPSGQPGKNRRKPSCPADSEPCKYKKLFLGADGSAHEALQQELVHRMRRAHLLQPAARQVRPEVGIHSYVQRCLEIVQ